MPECTATADNYYVREGKYITEWEPEVIGQIYGAAYRNGAVTEEIRFSDTSLYDQAKAYLIDEQHIRDYCEGITGLSYIEDRDQNVLILKFFVEKILDKKYIKYNRNLYTKQSFCANVM